MKLFRNTLTAFLIFLIPPGHSEEVSCQASSTQSQEPTYHQATSSWLSFEPILSSLEFVTTRVRAARTAFEIYPALSEFGEQLKQEAERTYPALPENLPHHIAIIMDGNRRYAQKQALDQKSYGHFFGAARLLQATRVAELLGIQQLTVYALSKENLERSQEEVEVLMTMVKTVFEHWGKNLADSTIKVQHLGFREGLRGDVLQSIDSIVEMTRDHQGPILNICFNYGGLDEITSTITRLIKAGTPASTINNTFVEQHLLTGRLEHWTNPELLIRTGGQKRLSNFLPLQTRYSEFYFTDILWPEFTPDDFITAIEAYSSRKRNFGR